MVEEIALLETPRKDPLVPEWIEWSDKAKATILEMTAMTMTSLPLSPLVTCSTEQGLTDKTETSTDSSHCSAYIAAQLNELLSAYNYEYNYIIDEYFFIRS